MTIGVLVMAYGGPGRLEDVEKHVLAATAQAIPPGVHTP